MKALLKGIPASGGIVTGKVRIYNNRKIEFNPGDILVTRITDPTMVGAMVKAGAIVTDIGGITSHPAIVSREMGIPCVVNTIKATKVLKNGDEIIVNGNTGEISKVTEKQEKNDYPKWIDDWSKSGYLLFEGNIAGAFEPLDFFHYFPMWFDLWYDKLYETITKLGKEKISESRILKSLPVASSVRAIIFKNLSAIAQNKNIDSGKIVKVLDFFIKYLQKLCTKDPYSYDRNLIHSDNQVNDILQKINWNRANSDESKLLGQIYTSALSLVHGLYNDVSTDCGVDIYGPYKVRFKGTNKTLIIRHFPNLQTKELWEINKNPIKELMIYQLYSPIDIRIPLLGCHIITRGNPVEQLTDFAVYADGKLVNDIKDLQEITKNLIINTEIVYTVVKSMDIESLKRKVILQENYQLKDLFELAKIDWEPSQEMYKRVKNKAIPKGFITTDRTMTFKEFEQQFGINKIKEIYKERK